MQISETNITGTLPPTGNLKPNLKASPSLSKHAKTARPVNHDINTRVLTPRFGSKKKIGNLDYVDRHVSTCREIF